jgi:DNA-binding XRE family transcriptional regulator
MKNNLSELRKMENLTQEQLAEKLNLSLATSNISDMINA